MPDIKYTLANKDDVDELAENVNDIVPMKRHASNLYDYTKRSIGYTLSNGNLYPDVSGAYDTSDYIKIEAGETYVIGTFVEKRRWIYDAAKWMWFYDSNKNYLSGANIDVSGSNGVFVAPANSNYVRFTIDMHASNNFYKQVVLLKGDTLPKNYIKYMSDYVIKEEYIAETIKNLQKWAGKKWVSYGDSITAANEWQPYVAAYFGLNHLCRGVGGSAFTQGKGVEYYYANPDGSYHSVYLTDSTTPEGKIMCEGAFNSDERIDLSIPIDTNLIIIAGGTNDHGTDAPIGDTDYEMVDGVPTFDTTTFKGAVCTCVYKMIAKYPNAIVMLQTPPNTRSTDGVLGVNALGLTIQDYAKAIKECAMFMSVPCIDVYGESGINQFNLINYGNNLHPDDLGGRKIAQAVIAKLKTYEPVGSLFD